MRPATRVNEFPNEHLIVSFGKLFCSVCQETQKILLQNLSFFFHAKHVATSISKSFLYNISATCEQEKLKSIARQEKITVSLKHLDVMKVILSVMLIGCTELKF